MLAEGVVLISMSVTRKINGFLLKRIIIAEGGKDEHMNDTLLGFYNGDCMEYLRQMPDNAYDLAIVDPPYGDAGGGGAVRKDLEDGSTDTARRIPRKKHVVGGYVKERTSRTDRDGGRMEPTVSRTGGTWAEKFGKKS